MDRKAYISALESSLINILKSAIIKILITKLPFLSFAPLSPILAYVVGKLVELGVKEASLRTFFIYCDLRTNYQASSYEKAAIDYEKNKNPETERAMLEKFYSLASLHF